jgi:HK97 family phage portal protein
VSLFFAPRAEQRGMDWWGQGFDSPPGSRVVTPETATYLAPVFAAIRHIVDYASTLPADYYRDNGDGTTTEVAAPPLFRAQDAPGKPGLGQWIGQAMYGVVTDGNAVGWIVDVDSYGNPTDVLWLNHARWNYDLTHKVWLVDGEPVPPSRIVHVPWIVPPGRVLGLSPIEHFKSVVSAGLSAQEYADLKRGGGIPPLVLKNSGTTLTAEQAETMKRRATASFAKGDPFVTGSDWDLNPVAIPPNMTEFITTLKMSANAIASVYGLEAREVGGESTGSDTLKYVNDESLELNRQANLLPYMVRLEQAFTRLMPLKQYFRFNLDARIRTDTKTRFEIYALELTMGTRSVNEIRDLEDRPRVAGGDYFNVPKPAPAGAPAQGPDAVPIPTLPK